MHKSIRLQLPDLRILSINADFSVSVFASVCKLCKDLGMNRNILLFLIKNFFSKGIRHAEELSLLRSPKTTNTNGSSERRTSPRRRRNNIGTLNRHNSMGDSLANNTSTLSTLFSPTTPKLRSTVSISAIIEILKEGHWSKSLSLFDELISSHQ
jgi:hypothetical protein